MAKDQAGRRRRRRKSGRYGRRKKRREEGKGRKRGESGGGTEKAHGSVRREDLSGGSVEDGLRAKESGLQAVDSPAAHPFPAVRTVTRPQEA